MSDDAPPAGFHGEPSENGGHASRRVTTAAAAALVLPVLATLAVPVYARVEPRMAGVPFFYWYQFACVLLTAAGIAAALRITRRQRGTVSERQPW